MAGRYSNAVTYFNGTSGKALWHLGGKNNSFKDASWGRATKFVDPHMARFDDNRTAITLFDNMDFRTLGTDEPKSFAGKIAVD